MSDVLFYSRNKEPFLKALEGKQLKWKTYTPISKLSRVTFALI